MSKYIIIPLLNLLICQILKCLIESFKIKKFDVKRMLSGSGGMPSSHSMFIWSITTLIGMDEGINSSLFAFSLIVSFIICYDAMVVRKEVENHSKALKKITKENFKEEIGHTFLEVIIGSILGIICAYLFNKLF